MSKVIISTPLAPAAIGPYSQAVAAGGMLYVSGCLGMIPETKALVAGGVSDQTTQALENMKNIIEAGGADLSRVVKCTILLADMSHFAEVNAVYGKYFAVDPPARVTYAVAGLPLNALIEIDAICSLH